MISPVLIIEKDDVDDTAVPQTFLWGSTQRQKKKSMVKGVIREKYKRERCGKSTSADAIKFTGDLLILT